MIEQLKTIREALESYLGGETDGMNGAFRNCCSTRPHEPHSDCEAEAALAALTQLEAMMGEQEPVACVGSYWNDGKGFDLCDFSGNRPAPGAKLYTTPVAQQPQAEAVPPDVVRDAERWRMLPAYFYEYQIDAMKLYRDIDAAIAQQKGQQQ